MRLFPILMLGLLAYAADPREAAIDAAGTSFIHCWDTRDTECLSKLVTDDFVLVTRNGKLMDKAVFLEGMKAGRYSQSVTTATPAPRRDAKLRFYGNTAILTYAETGPAPSYAGKQDGNMVDYYETKVWVTADGKNWRLASMHVSMLPLPPAK